MAPAIFSRQKYGKRKLPDQLKFGSQSSIPYECPDRDGSPVPKPNVVRLQGMLANRSTPTLGPVVQNDRDRPLPPLPDMPPSPSDFTNDSPQDSRIAWEDTLPTPAFARKTGSSASTSRPLRTRLDSAHPSPSISELPGLLRPVFDRDRSASTSTDASSSTATGFPESQGRTIDSVVAVAVDDESDHQSKHSVDGRNSPNTQPKAHIAELEGVPVPKAEALRENKPRAGLRRHSQTAPHISSHLSSHLSSNGKLMHPLSSHPSNPTSAPSELESNPVQPPIAELQEESPSDIPGSPRSIDSSMAAMERTGSKKNPDDNRETIHIHTDMLLESGGLRIDEGAYKLYPQPLSILPAIPKHIVQLDPNYTKPKDGKQSPSPISPLQANPKAELASSGRQDSVVTEKTSPKENTISPVDSIGGQKAPVKSEAKTKSKSKSKSKAKTAGLPSPTSIFSTSMATVPMTAPISDEPLQEALLQDALNDTALTRTSTRSRRALSASSTLRPRLNLGMRSYTDDYLESSGLLERIESALIDTVAVDDFDAFSPTFSEPISPLPTLQRKRTLKYEAESPVLGKATSRKVFGRAELADLPPAPKLSPSKQTDSRLEDKTPTDTDKILASSIQNSPVSDVPTSVFSNVETASGQSSPNTSVDTSHTPQNSDDMGKLRDYFTRKPKTQARSPTKAQAKAETKAKAKAQTQPQIQTSPVRKQSSAEANREVQSPSRKSPAKSSTRNQTASPQPEPVRRNSIIRYEEASPETSRSTATPSPVLRLSPEKMREPPNSPPNRPPPAPPAARDSPSKTTNTPTMMRESPTKEAPVSLSRSGSPYKERSAPGNQYVVPENIQMRLLRARLAASEAEVLNLRDSHDRGVIELRRAREEKQHSRSLQTHADYLEKRLEELSDENSRVKRAQGDEVRAEVKSVLKRSNLDISAEQAGRADVAEEDALRKMFEQMDHKALIEAAIGLDKENKAFASLVGSFKVEAMRWREKAEAAQKSAA